MKSDIPHTFEDKEAQIKLIAESFEEPNYGRTFWTFKFHIKDKLANDEVLDYDNDGLFTNLKHFQLSSEDHNYFYIPKYEPVIYNRSKDKFIKFKAPSIERNSDFIKNYFYNNTLVVVYANGLFVINLETNTTKTIKYHPKEVCIEDAIQINENEIELDYGDLVEKRFTKKIIQI